MKLAPFVACIVLWSSAASAEEASHAVTVTFSPLHLIFPMFEVQADYNVAPHMAAGLIAGGGKVSDKDNTITATALEIGAQYNYYIFDNFDGLHAGVEVQYVHLSDVPQDLTLTAAGLAVGPYAGYKVMAGVGFTFVAQLGVYYLALQAESSSAMKSDSDIGVLLNLNVGWSF